MNERAVWQDDILDFWFGLKPKQWWTSDPQLDAFIRDRFCGPWKEKRQLPPEMFVADARTALAGVILDSVVNPAIPPPFHQARFLQDLAHHRRHVDDGMFEDLLALHAEMASGPGRTRPGPRRTIRQLGDDNGRDHAEGCRRNGVA